MTKALYIAGMALVAVQLVLWFTGPVAMAWVMLGAAGACLSVAWFANPAAIEKNIRFQNPAAKRITAYFLAALMGLIALMVAAVPFMLSAALS